MFLGVTGELAGSNLYSCTLSLARLLGEILPGQVLQVARNEVCNYACVTLQTAFVRGHQQEDSLAQGSDGLGVHRFGTKEPGRFLGGGGE